MGKNFQLWKNFFFCHSFLSKVRTYTSTNFNKKSLLEQIFRLVEMLFRNDIALCMATAALSCRDKLLMKNLIPANMNLISG